MRIGNRDVWVCLAGLAILLAGDTTYALENTKPNVLFISVDDMNNSLNCYGDTEIKSPNLDKLAAQGVRFDRAYCQFPLCSPSRSSLLTGRRPDTTRVFDLAYHFRDGLPDVVTLPQMFMNQGYYVARVGKMYHYGNPGGIGTSGLDDPKSWQEVYNPAGIDHTKLEPIIVNHTPKRGLGSAMSYYADPDGKDEEHTDGMVASEAIRLLEAHKDQPFFLGVGFYKPHTPYVAPKKYFDLYPLDQVKVPDISRTDVEGVPPLALASTSPWPNFGVSLEDTRKCKQGYMAVISFVDAQIGRVLEALDRLGLRERTIVVFWSDHGYHTGEHGLWMKRSCFEESARVPLLISAPGLAKGKACERTVELVDLYPTLADLAGIPAPDGYQGASLKPLLADPTRAWDRPAFTQVTRNANVGYSVRTERWRYNEWNDGEKGIELYDHESDPKETHNLASDPRFEKERAELKALVKKNWPVRVKGGEAPTKASTKKAARKASRAQD